MQPSGVTVMSGIKKPETSEILADPLRLSAVRASGLLDSPAEDAFDRLTRLAAKLTNTPVTFISVVDEQRDFYKSCVGFPESLAGGRQMTGPTFCHYALSSDGPLIINDTMSDPVYSQVPTVKSLGVRAYVGVPLTLASGQTIGSFCAMDFEPRAWTRLDVEVMTELAASTLREIELRMALEEIMTDQARLHELARSNEFLYKEAQLANQEKDRFFAAVSHELRSPMTSIMGWAGILRDEVASNPVAAEAAAMIESSAREQARMVDDLLDATRSSTGKLSLDCHLIDLSVVIEEAVRAALPAAATKGVLLQSSIEPLPPLPADAIRMRQVFNNLISNAIKFTPPGGSVNVLAQAAASFVRVEVRDSGRGIDTSLIPHLFNRGWQATPGEQGGLGLGLTIASQIADLHGGVVTAESKGPETGSSFVVTLPIDRPES